MLKAVRWILLVLGLALLLKSGVTIFSVPDTETLYHFDPPLVICQPKNCFGTYFLYVGNTGQTVQPDVKITLRKGILDEVTGRISAADFGVVRRDLTFEETEDSTVVSLGPIEPKEEVKVYVMMQKAERSLLPEWKDLLLDVSAEEGPVLRGVPSQVRFLRFWSVLGNMF